MIDWKSKVASVVVMLAMLVIPTAPAIGLSPDQRKLFDSGVYYFDAQPSAVCNDIGIANGSIDRFLQVLAYQESSGNPTAKSGASSASGKYQYIDSTWRARASLYGPAGNYARAADAPEAVQDAVAYIEYTQKFRSMNNDLFKLAVSHFLPAAITNESLLDIIPGRNTITPRQYAEKLIESISNGVGSDITLSYHNAPEFSIWIEKVGGEAPGINTVSSSGCIAGGTASKVIQIAEGELALGAKEENESYLKYTNGVRAEWCAFFVSWVFETAGAGFEGGTISTASGIMAYGDERGWFHPKGEAGFVPQPGDIAVYKEGLMPFPSHVNIVVSYESNTNTYTSIGGNESNTIKKASYSAELPALTGFVRIP